MRNEAPHPELSSLLSKFDAAGGVLDYVFLKRMEMATPQLFHRAAALAATAEIDRRLERWAIEKSSAKHPIQNFFRLHWDEATLTGKQISVSTFWGTDNVELKQTGPSSWSIPTVDGYKTAFFHPPYGLQGSASANAELFAAINRYVLGAELKDAEIFSWSTDWSNYFDAGNEWWGAFYWTIRPIDSEWIVAVGASSTD